MSRSASGWSSRRRRTLTWRSTAREELAAKGVEFAGDTLDTGVCHMAFFTDPDGNDLMLHHRDAPYD